MASTDRGSKQNSISRLDLSKQSQTQAPVASKDGQSEQNLSENLIQDLMASTDCRSRQNSISGLVNKISNNPKAFFLDQDIFIIIGAQNCIKILRQNPRQDWIPSQMKKEPLKNL